LLPDEEVTQLQFPNLEVLEMDEMGQQFPTWMAVPPTSNVSTYSFHSDLPAINELWIKKLSNWRSLSSRCPNLQVLRLELNQFASRKHLSLSSKQGKRTRKEDLKLKM